MKWVRCPKCRTLNDVDRYAMCDGCSGDLAGLPAVQGTRTSSAHRDAAGDTGTSRRVLWIIAVALLLGTFFLPAAAAIFTAIGAFLVLAGLFMYHGFRSVGRSGMNPLAKLIVGLLAFAAALGGAFFLVLIACSGPASRFRL